MKKNSNSIKVPNITHHHRHIIKSIKAQANAKRTISEKLSDWVTKIFGGVTFLVLNVIWFTSWVLVNTNSIPGVEAFDPYPFGLLTMIVSLEAILLSIFVLMSQNRSAKTDDLREETDLQLDMIAEKELTKLLRMVATLMEKDGIDISKDKELMEMLKPTDLDKLKKVLEEQV
ncbi:MAG: DUF1003 domain-containing protein [Patescibacteria group bacterium]